MAKTATPTEEITSDGLLTAVEAADFLRVSRSAIYTIMRNGNLPYVVMGKHRRIPRKALVAFAEKALTPAKPHPWDSHLKGGKS